MMADGIIRLGTFRADYLDFTSEEFSADSYLWKKGNQIIVSFIDSKFPGKGNFKKLIAVIEEKGFEVAVPTPLGKMQDILHRWGFIPHHIVEDGVELWKRPKIVEA